MTKKLKCIIVDDEDISRIIIEKFVEKTDFLEVSARCKNAIEAVNVLNNAGCDILFLDVEMPEMSGLELLSSMRKKPQVILVTSKEEYALQAFNLDVCDYILKPAQYPRFLKAVSKAKELLDSDGKSVSSDSIFVKTDGRHVRILYSEIDYVKGAGDYVSMVCGKHTHLVLSTMSNIESVMPNEIFCRVHKSYIVNLSRVTTIEDNTIVVCGEVVPIGQQYRDNFFKKISVL